MTFPTNWKSTCVAGTLLLVALVPLIVCLYKAFVAKRNRRLKSPWLWTGMSVVGVVAAVVVGSAIMLFEASVISMNCHARLYAIRSALGQYRQDCGRDPESLRVLNDKGYLHSEGVFLCGTTRKPFCYRKSADSDRSKHEIIFWDPYDHGVWVPFYNTDFHSVIRESLALHSVRAKELPKECQSAISRGGLKRTGA